MATDPISILNGWQPNNFAGNPANALQALPAYAAPAPVSDMSGYVPPDPTQGPAGLGGLVTPAQQQNVMQQMAQQQGTMQPAPDPAAPSPAAPPQQQQAPINPLAAPGAPQGQLPDQAAPGGNTPRKRLSALDVIGRLSDVFAKVGGAPEQFQPYLDSRVKTAQEQEAAGLDNTAKRQDISQTGNAVQIQHNAILGQAFRGLKALQAANPSADINVAWPALAQQLGIDHASAAQVGAALQADPANLDALIAATSPVAKPGEGSKFGQQLFYTTDANGVRHAYQTNSAGGVQEVQFGAGEHPSDSVMDVDTGDKRVLASKSTGNVIRSFVKAGAPEAGYAPKVDDKGNVTSYTPVPGSKADVTNQAAVQKQQDAQTAKAAAYTNSRASLVDLDRSLKSIATDPELSSATGAYGTIAGHVPGTAAKRVQSNIDTATGQSLQAAMAQLREGSKDGSLGIRLTQKELYSLSDTIGALHRTDQSTDDYRATVNKARMRVSGIVQRMDAAHASGAAPPAPIAPKAPAAVAAPKAPAGWKISVVK